MTDATVYEHTQRSYVWIMVGALILVVVAIPLALGEAFDVAGFVFVVMFLAVVVAIVGAFSSLTTTVTASEVTTRFRWGWPRKKIQRPNILSHAPARNRWFYGWGIRWIPNGMLWNVWGLDAVELTLAGGRRFRIGTDDPNGLDAALSR